jgi:diketogulonate reductase-like aldo/keto reductase
VFAFARRIGILPLTGTTDEVHMKEDLASVELELSSADVDAISALA